MQQVLKTPDASCQAVKPLYTRLLFSYPDSGASNGAGNADVRRCCKKRIKTDGTSNYQVYHPGSAPSLKRRLFTEGYKTPSQQVARTRKTLRVTFAGDKETTWE